MSSVAWIAVDWGTSRLRAWAMSSENEVIEAYASEDGMAHLERDGFAPALVNLVGAHLGQSTMSVVACGMVGARQGWAEAAYSAAPCAPPGITSATKVRDAAFDVSILPGVKQIKPADVMRGEETQIAGFLSKNPSFDGVLCLPGTHTKWVHISAGEIVSFRTAMTGEMFALLSQRSTLRHGVDNAWDDEAFNDAVDTTLSKPELLAASLFGIRARNLLNGTVPGRDIAWLSGLLIGAELASMRPYWLGQRVAIVGSSRLCARYSAALRRQGLRTEVALGEEMTLAGLIAARVDRKEPA